jgi:hypothetical protein
MFVIIYKMTILKINGWMDEWARLAPYPTEWTAGGELDHSIVLSPKKKVIQIGPKSKSMKSNCNTQNR